MSERTCMKNERCTLIMTTHSTPKYNSHNDRRRRQRATKIKNKWKWRRCQCAFFRVPESKIKQNCVRANESEVKKALIRFVCFLFLSFCVRLNITTFEFEYIFRQYFLFVAFGFCRVHDSGRDERFFCVFRNRINEWKLKWTASALCHSHQIIFISN